MALQAILVQVGITAGLWAVQKWVLPLFGEEAQYKKPQPEDITFALGKVGDPIALVYGTTRVDAPFLAWSGRRDVTNFGGGDFLYHVAMLVVAGVPPWHKYDDPADDENEDAPFAEWRASHPVKWKRFWWGDIEISDGTVFEHGDTADPMEWDIDSPGAGGIVLRCEFFDGRPDQLVTTYPTAVASTPYIDWLMDAAGVDRSLIPGFRHQMLCVIDGSKHPTTPGLDHTIGRSHAVPGMGLEIQAVGCQPIGDDANPVWVIFDLLCSPVWKIGYSMDRVDIPSFQFAANEIEDEEHGISLAIYQNRTASETLMGICDQIDALMFEDMAGKIHIRLIRQNYIRSFLPTLDEDNTIGRPVLKQHGWRDRSNVCRVKFTDRARSYQPNDATAHRLGTDGGYQMRRKPKEVEYTGITTYATARTVAERELAYASKPFMTAIAKVSREWDWILPGGALIANWPQYNCTNMVFRVAHVDYGTWTDGTITLQLVEDIFDNGRY